MQYCSTCLSNDRRLKALKDIRKIVPILRMLNIEVNYNSHKVPWKLHLTKDYICWECEAYLLKLLQFRKQVILAQKKLDIWHRCKQAPNILKRNNRKSLSRLTVCKQDVYSQFYFVELSVQEDHITDKIQGDITEIKKYIANYTEDVTNNDYIANNDDRTMVNDFEETGNGDDRSCGDADDLKVTSEDFEVDYIEDWDMLEEDGGKCKADEDVALLIVDNEEEHTSDSHGSDIEDYIDFNKKPEVLSKEEENFKILRMGLDELYACREQDRKATVYSRSRHQCRMCVVAYYQEWKFEKHLASKHDVMFQGIRRKYVCKVCESRFPKRQDLLVHYERHFRKYECKLCGYTSHKLPTMFQHHSRKHPQNRLYFCTICNLEFKTLYSFDRHCQSHKYKPKCQICDKTFKTAAGLRMHVGSHKKRNSDEEQEAPESNLEVARD